MNAVDRARCSLEGLSVGDAFGEQFFGPPDQAAMLVTNRIVPENEWPFTDDTNMALSICACLARYGKVEQDWLAADFAKRYDPLRDYGGAMHSYLECIRKGADWRVEAPELFCGEGSFGNGAAMRVAPVGAYFADDLQAVVDNARRSAEVTHAHPEGIAGAVAVAAAAAWASRLRGESRRPSEREFLDLILPLVPDSKVREGIRQSRDLTPGCPIQQVAAALGNGSGESAQDTVPFALWCAACHMDDYVEALWLTVGGLGDRDTTCAIVGGIVASYTGTKAIPAQWLRNREPLPKGAFQP